MSDLLNSNKNIVLHLNNSKDKKMIYKISHALDSMERIEILRSILYKSKNLSDIAKELNLPISSVARHIDILADSQLILISYQPGLKGHTKYCSQTILGYTVSLETAKKENNEKKEYAVELPIGIFSHCHITPPCGMASQTEIIKLLDEPSVFFSPERINAQCLWFDKGFISYNFPAEPLLHHKCSEISFSFEICSETVYYNNNWPSDITIYINDIEITTFTSPGDFGGRRGKYTPNYWPVTSTQFGLLKIFSVNELGVYIDNVFDNDKIKFNDLKLYDANSIKLTIGIKDTATHKGGINLFGENFGDYKQGIIMKIK